MSATSAFYTERLQRDEYAKWISDFADWSHAVTVTCQPSPRGFPRTKTSTIYAVAHFVNVVNRRVLGSARARKGCRIACVAVYGGGAYGDNPHVHLAFQAPPDLSYDEMYQAIEHSIHRTKGFGIKHKIKPCTSQGWLTYMLDHGTEGLLVELTSPAKY
jgi:hypothetical protein